MVKRKPIRRREGKRDHIDIGVENAEAEGRILRIEACVSKEFQSRTLGRVWKARERRDLVGVS